MEFDEMVRFAVENGASDIHLASNNLPSYRKNGKTIILCFSDYQEYGKIGS